MVILLENRALAFVVAAGIAAAAEGVVIWQQWPSPPLKVCASVELAELMATASKAEAELHEARNHLKIVPAEAAGKDVIRMEAASAAAWNEVANYKQKVQARQKAGGEAARDGSCS